MSKRDAPEGSITFTNGSTMRFVGPGADRLRSSAGVLSVYVDHDADVNRYLAWLWDDPATRPRLEVYIRGEVRYGAHEIVPWPPDSDESDD